MLYTGKGDKGTTKFFDTGKGVRVSKGSLVAEALGALDELNSFLGLVKAKAREDDSEVAGEKLSAVLHEIQETLFIVQAEMAGADKRVTEEKVKKIEKITDVIEAEIPKITGFSIPGGTELSALLDVARATARRTERGVTRAVEAGERELSEHTRAYVNRLSSVLFALARLANHRAEVPEQNPSYK